MKKIQDLIDEYNSKSEFFLLIVFLSACLWHGLGITLFAVVDNSLRSEDLANLDAEMKKLKALDKEVKYENISEFPCY